MVERVELSGNQTDTTNNRMELTAPASALAYVRGRPGYDPAIPIQIVSDSEYVVKGFSERLPGWIRKNWRGSDRKPIKNPDLWQVLQSEAEGLSITFKWVKGHAGDSGNKAADALAAAAMARLTDPQQGGSVCSAMPVAAGLGLPGSISVAVPESIPEVCRGVPFMTSLEIAEMTGKRHANVLRDIQRELAKIGEAELKFASSYRDSSGKSNVCYCLPGTYLLFIASAYDAKLRFQIIKHWEALNNGTAAPVYGAADVLAGSLVMGGRKTRLLELREAEERAALTGTWLTRHERNMIMRP